MDNVAVDRTIVMKSFASGAILSSTGLNQMVCRIGHYRRLLYRRGIFFNYCGECITFGKIYSLTTP